MDFVTGVGAWGGWLLGYAIPFLFVLTIVVFFHELGHFWVARRCGVKVSAFSIGFGPELLGFTDRHGTRWRFAAIPLGGYVRFYGDDNAASTPNKERLANMSEEERRSSFFHKPVWARAAVVVAGPLANFVLAMVIFSVLFMVYGRQTTTPHVDAVQAGSVAEQAGFKPGDLVTSINGRPIESFGEMQRIIQVSPAVPLKIVVVRAGREVELTATPELRETKDALGNVHRVGMLGITRTTGGGEVVNKPTGPIEAIRLGIAETWYVIERTLTYVGGLFMGRESMDQLGGVIRIAQVSGQVATVGFSALMHLTAILSVSIGLLNLFPIPLLDGGHLLFYGIEALRGRPLSERAQEMGFRIGLAIVVMLMIVATWNDLLHLRAL